MIVRGHYKWRKNNNNLQNVNGECVCLFATLWKCAVSKFTYRYKKLFILCWKTSLSLSLFFFLLLLVHRTSVPIAIKTIHNSDFFVFFFICSKFCQCTLLCSTTVLSSVFVLAHTHTRALEESKWMCSFHILVPLNCMEIITFLINYCKKNVFFLLIK